MSDWAGVFSVVWDNLLGYDIIIFLVACINACCYTTARKLAGGLHNKLHKTIFLPEHVLKNDEMKRAFQEVSEGELVAMRKRVNGIYAIYENLTGIFTLLGILGTVVSLIPMVEDLVNLRQNFFAALTSTFWGLVFGIAFKFLDGFLAPRMEENNSNISLYLERSQKLREEAPCETKA
ncbi:MAG: MotA/TolQ/ExbB proton channel family protein [Clostridiales bacterium]|jgi:chemotaxis protein MotA|nr:MotA/TolQ/ExbB proton channel family protein [Clostridiales bacterium]